MRDSIWFETIGARQRALLETSDELPQTAEVAIAGAGMIGLAAAYWLSLAGVRDICVVDARGALAGASGANAGGLWFGHESAAMPELAPLAAASSRLYEELAAAGLELDFRRTGVIELGAEAGGGERLGETELRELEPALAPEAAAEGGRWYADDAQVNPVKLGASLMEELRNRGVRFCFGAAVRSAGPPMETDRGTVSAGAVVVACGAETSQVLDNSGWRLPVRPMRGHLAATRRLAPVMRHTVIGPRYYYWQLAEGYVAGGGTVEDVGFRGGLDRAALAAIREERDRLFPGLRSEPDERAWYGFRPYPGDAWPVVGRVPGHERLYVAAGHFRKGILLAPVTGRMVADFVTRGATELPAAALDPARFR